ncbi:MAG: carboxylesterase family protein, partial [Bacteroidales bacterium]|nr:carboxylesterase family protein [Bacteroidales bacterium]
MSLPEAQGLFARAIAMSPCLSHCYTLAESEQRAARFLRCAAVGKQHADKVLTLSDKRLANTGRHFVAQTALSGDVRCAFGPWVDGELIREMPAVGAARCTR